MSFMLYIENFRLGDLPFSNQATYWFSFNTTVEVFWLGRCQYQCKTYVEENVLPSSPGKKHCPAALWGCVGHLCQYHETLGLLPQRSLHLQAQEDIIRRVDRKVMFLCAKMPRFP